MPQVLSACSTLADTLAVPCQDPQLVPLDELAGSDSEADEDMFVGEPDAAGTHRAQQRAACTPFCRKHVRWTLDRTVS